MFFAGCQRFGHKLLANAQGPSNSAVTGGISAALVSAILREPLVHPPVICQDLEVESIHWGSLCLGIFLGLVLGQVLEYLILLRQYLNIQLKLRVGAVHNYWAVKSRLA